MTTHTSRTELALARLLLLPLVLVLGGLIAWPVLQLVASSLASSTGGWTLANYTALATDGQLRGALLSSVTLSAAVAVGSTFLCLAPAWVLVRWPIRGKRLLRATLALPMSLSGVIVGFLWILMLGRSGLVPQLAEAATGEPWLSGAAYTMLGIASAYLYFEIPRATLSLEAALRKFDFRLEAAARTLGAGRWQRFLWVILPAIWPAVVSTFAITFSVSLGSFGVVLLLSTRSFSVLPLEIFMELFSFPSNPPLAAAMSVALILLALGFNYGLGRLAEHLARARGIGAPS